MVVALVPVTLRDWIDEAAAMAGETRSAYIAAVLAGLGDELAELPAQLGPGVPSAACANVGAAVPRELRRAIDHAASRGRLSRGAIVRAALEHHVVDRSATAFAHNDEDQNRGGQTLAPFVTANSTGRRNTSR